MSQFYFDNNFLRYAFKLNKTEYNETLLPAFQFGVDWKGQYQIQGTYFLVLEAVGIRTTFLQDLKVPDSDIEKVRHYKKIDAFDKMWEKVGDLVSNLYISYKAKLATSNELSLEYLNQKCIEQKDSLSDTWLFRDVVERNFNELEEFREGMIEWLSFERVLSQNYPKDIRVEIFSFLMNESNTFLSQKKNNSFVKFYYNLGKDLCEDMRKKDLLLVQKLKSRYKKFNITTLTRRKRRFFKFKKLVKRVRFRFVLSQQINAKGKFGLTRDNVDAEIIHLLVCGSQIHATDKKIKINVVSSDNLESILSRVSIYKSYLSESYLMRKNGPFEFNEGCFFYFDKDLKKITHYFYSKDVIPYFEMDTRGVAFLEMCRSSIQAV